MCRSGFARQNQDNIPSSSHPLIFSLSPSPSPSPSPSALPVLRRVQTKLEKAVPEEDREDFAALVIQRSWRRITRMRKAKSERNRRRTESANKLQATYRGHLTRLYVVKLHKSAARMQGLGRGWLTRRKLWLEKKEAMCKKIQKWYRACMARDLLNKMRREIGSSTLQRVYRGHLGRREYKFR